MSAAERVASMSPDELIAVITRGLDADERAAKAWLPLGNPDEAARNHVARYDPGHVLADVESKREVIRAYKDATLSLSLSAPGTPPHDLMTGATNTVVNVLRSLARPYLDRDAS